MIGFTFPQYEKTRTYFIAIFFASMLLMSNVSVGYSITLDSFIINPSGTSPTGIITMCVSSIGDVLAGVFSGRSLNWLQSEGWLC